ncbi:hypothetical protein B0T11DRAFT_359664 [Plectosphaerella cucumerina]|uniref:Uncharacterized protein n=1 Tax=Plectosphaerella cucumerina TaxID=40658 RepID=A0A8K0T4D1_9PEZI|nr:hypothetical protein B0T11DRAFT_359664 [Plectosphaerella cucumerina]
MATAPLDLPGHGKPLDDMGDDDWYSRRFPTLLTDEFQAPTLTIREFFMLWCVEQITNKPGWNTKVFDDEILAKWKNEVEDAPWNEVTGFREGGPCSDEMWQFIVKELQHKAKLYEATGIIPIFDTDNTVIKSDTLVDEELKLDLRHAVAALENVPDKDKDWHPRSDGKVLDLVHPSLWPLTYGRSRISNDPITLESCLDKCGAGEIIPHPKAAPPRYPEGSWQYHDNSGSLWSNRYQWLPCDVDISGSPKIVSYINNLHPVRHRDLYGIIERFVGKSLPLWDQIYRRPHQARSLDAKAELRIQCKSVSKECTTTDICEESDNGCDPANRPLDEGEDERIDEQEYWELDKDHPLKVKDNEWFLETHPCEQPEPLPFEESSFLKIDPEDIQTKDFFALKAPEFYPAHLKKPDIPPRTRIQVIVKLANIHLTPEKPKYDGGSWHIEGQMNEHICATALYYYDNENITPSHLAFRTVANEEDLQLELGYEQSDFHSINGTFAIDADGNTLQDIGRTLTPEGRLLAFPNVYQHRVSPFELVDKTRPGHRKILALFLVDPSIPIISTAHVAPQQASWWLGEDGIAARSGEMAKLPREIVDMVNDNMDWPIPLSEAKARRLELMDERTQMDSMIDHVVSDATWNFCEH